MREATRIAWRGAGRTGTNPMVGSVVVAGGIPVAAAYHGQNGIAHAEVLALDSAGPAARGSTLYASLEPCAHHGRTPPCVDRIVAAGVSRVVIPALDPDSRVLGRGVSHLRARGVQVDIGCLEGTAILDSLGYYHDRLGLASMLTLKTAVSRDGKVSRASGRRDDVTSEAARREVHALRAVHDAVLTGIGTVLVDAPRLDCRLLDVQPDRLPVPVVLDTRLRLPADNAWSRAGRRFVVVAGPDADATRARAIEARGGEVIRCRTSARGVDVAAALDALAQRGLRRVLVEAGPGIVASVVESGRWDAAWFYRSSDAFGPEGPALPISGPPGIVVDECAAGPDIRVRSVNQRTLAEITGRLRVAGA